MRARAGRNRKRNEAMGRVSGGGVVKPREEGRPLDPTESGSARTSGAGNPKVAKPFFDKRKHFTATPDGPKPHRGAPHAYSNNYPPVKAVAPVGAGESVGAHGGEGTHWGGVANWYDELVGDEGSEYHREVILPGVLRLLEQKKAKATDESVTKAPAFKQKIILDLACGQGVMCRALATENPAWRVVGVDAASELIRAAEARNKMDRLPIEYIVADATKLREYPELKPLAEVGVDAITCILAIQNMSPLSPIWEACARLLKPQGKLILVMMHPSFRIPKKSGWGWDERTHSQYRRVEGYMSSTQTKIQMHPGADPSATTVTFHRPLQAYINTLTSHGLLIDHLDEWVSHKTSQPGPKQAALDQSRKDIPMFMAIRATLVDGATKAG